MASYTTKERSESHTCSFSTTSSSVSADSVSSVGVSSPSSMLCTAFMKACSKLLAMAITSPVAIICVPRDFLAYTNLSNGHFGNLTTQ